MDLPVVTLPAGTETLRAEVRAFLAEQREAGAVQPDVDTWLSGFDPDFSRALGARGWLGMTWPRQFGGHERSALERFVVIEELLAAGAPVGAHWIADRQSGPAILRYGTPEQKAELLPRIVAGECYFAIGMSEPDTGSDLKSVATRAVLDGDSYVVNGTKVWTSNVHRCHVMITLVRTTDPGDDQRQGLSQLLVDLSTPGVTIRPIRYLTGGHHFNEVVFEDARIPTSALLGEEGDGWAQATAELAHERSGPERFLSTLAVLVELVRLAPADGTWDEQLGALTADLATLRVMSLGIAGLLERGITPDIEAALVKDLGTRFELEIIDVARRLRPGELSLSGADPLERHLAAAILHAPGFTLRGGTNEILRGIVARGLGLR